MLGDPKIRNEFYKDLDKLISQTDFTVISSTVLKDKLIKQYGPQANNPYNISLTFISNGTQFIKPDRFTKRLVDIDFKKKEENVAGTQLCDLVAYPLANYVLYPDRENLAFRIVGPKMYRQFPKDN